MTRRTASRLAALYPSAWRARYGEEFTHVLAEQPLTPRLFADVLGGALDARLHRSSATTESEGGHMVGNVMARCALGGSRLSTEDVWRANGVMIGASLAFAALYIWAKMQHLGNEEMVDAFGIMAFPAAMLLAAPFSYLKNATRAAQVLIVGGAIAILAAASYLAALI